MKVLNPLLQKEVSRKEFLTMATLGIASLTGIGTVLDLFTGSSIKQRLGQYTTGYGSSAYGGKKVTDKP
jgi:hypothetical protein